MAKKTAPRVTATATAQTTSEAPVPAPVVLTPKTLKLIEAVRAPLMEFQTAFKAFNTSRASLAPRFVKAFEAWTGETNGTFVGFVRLYDPSVSTERDQYRNNSFYQACQNLKRLYDQQNRPKVTRDPNAHHPVPPIEAVARLVATMAPLVANMDLIWAAFLQELHWTPRQVTRVQKLVGQVGKPLLVKKSPQDRKLHAVA